MSARIAPIVVLGAAAALVVVFGRRLLRSDPADGATVRYSKRSQRNMALARMGVRFGARRAVHATRTIGSDAETRARLDEEFQLIAAREITEELGQMKGAMMKLGQMASYLDDGLPEPVRKTLASLQSNAPPMSVELARAAVSAGLGRPLEEVFSSFDDIALAAASIGQVHGATLIDGTEVVVKVQYPGIAKAIASDLDNTDMVGRLMGLMFPALEAAPLVAELRVRIGEELDYRIEAENQQLFHDFFADHPFIFIPEVITNASSETVLTSSRANGVSWNEMCTWSHAETDLAAETMFRFVFRSLYRLRAFNGDPHPGNYLFEPGGRVTFIDFGLVRRFGVDEVVVFEGLIRAVLTEGDPSVFRKRLVAAGVLAADAPFSDAEIKDWFMHFYEVVREDAEVELDPAYASETVRRTFDARQNELLKHANVPPSFALIQRINLGLFSLMAHLRARGNFRAIAEELWTWTDGPPSTPLGELEAAWWRKRNP